MEQLRHLGESEERCNTLCGARLGDEHRYSNVDPANVTWDPNNDGSWISKVTCPECLRLAIKIGSDATNRLAELIEQGKVVAT